MNVQKIMNMVVGQSYFSVIKTSKKWSSRRLFLFSLEKNCACKITAFALQGGGSYSRSYFISLIFIKTPHRLRLGDFFWSKHWLIFQTMFIHLNNNHVFVMHVYVCVCVCEFVHAFMCVCWYKSFAWINIIVGNTSKLFFFSF